MTLKISISLSLDANRIDGIIPQGLQRAQCPRKTWSARDTRLINRRCKSRGISEANKRVAPSLFVRRRKQDSVHIEYGRR